MNIINPVLSDSTAGYMPAANNPSSTVATDSSDDTTTNSIDSRRYTQFDRTATEAGVATMSFDDFIDMVNPLQHIPVISSVYRAVENESINPVSRVVGDMIYSGPLGAVSAAMSGIGAIANSIIESQTGSDGTGNILASLFGTDEKTTPEDSIQVASDTTTPDAVKAQQMPVPLVATAALPVAVAKVGPQQDIQRPAKIMLTKSDNTDATAVPLSSTGIKLLPLDRSRMNGSNLANVANNIENQNRVIALSEGSHAMRLGHMIYTSPLMNGQKPIPNHPLQPTPTTVSSADKTGTNEQPAPTSDTAAASVTSSSTTSTSTQAASAPSSILSAKNNPMPPALFDDVMILKRLNQYKSFATAPTTNGATLDISN